MPNSMHKAAHLLDLLLRQLAHKLGAHHHGLLGQLALAKQLEVACGANEAGAVAESSEGGACGKPAASPAVAQFNCVHAGQTSPVGVALCA